MFQTTSLTALLTAIALLPTLAAAQTGEQACNGALRTVSAVSIAEQRVAAVDFAGSGGQLDPLLATRVTVSGGARSCLLINFSAVALPQDNHMMFQVLVDGVPVPGQGEFASVPGVPVVYDPEESDQNNGRMVAHTFVAPVNPGARLVELRFAGCCSASPANNSGVVRSATLSVQYR
ncbi:MAG: hypothetical protein IPG91_18835 [Ideonella sp.]|nr:hypothetical protein [Ideonella sp.]